MLFTSACVGLPKPTGPAEPWPIALRASIDRLNATSWALRKAAGGQCHGTRPAIGAAVDSILAYGAADRAAIATTLHMTELPQVAAVAPGSPAAVAGLQPGDDILAIGSTDMAGMVSRSPDSRLIPNQFDDVVANGPSDQNVAVKVRRDGKISFVTIKPVLACDARFNLKTTDSVDAYSDGKAIAVTTGAIAFSLSDDELALILGHELGHVIYHDEGARSIDQRRHMEDRADQLGVTLMRCAGYDLDKGVLFWTRFRSRDTFGFLRDSTHRSITARLALMESSPQPTVCPIDHGELDRADHRAP